jgi:hypothetical protein
MPSSIVISHHFPDELEDSPVSRRDCCLRWLGASGLCLTGGRNRCLMPQSKAETAEQSRARSSSISINRPALAAISRGRRIHRQEEPFSGAAYSALSISKSGQSSRLMRNRKVHRPVTSLSVRAEAVTAEVTYAFGEDPTGTAWDLLSERQAVQVFRSSMSSSRWSMPSRVKPVIIDPLLPNMLR